VLSSVLLATSLASASPENLLVGLAVQGSGLEGNPSVVTNGHLRPEGEPGSPQHFAVLKNPESHLVIDLGKAREIRAMVFQFDADDRYVIAVSIDGRHWEGLVKVEAGPAASGLRTRHVVFPEPLFVRFFAVHAEGGDGRYYVAQVQAYSEVPTP
jgi:F5/8 type C domain